MPEHSWEGLSNEENRDHSIHKAAPEGNIAALRAILEKEPEALDLQYRGEFTPLHLAILADKSDPVVFLLSEGADRAVKADPFPALPCAGTNCDAVTLAAAHGRRDSLGALLNYGIKVPAKAFIDAASIGRVESLRIIFEHLRTTKQEFADQKMLDCIRIALEGAAFCWHSDAVKYLLSEVEGFPNAQEEEDSKALQRALSAALEDSLCDDFCRNHMSHEKQFTVVEHLVNVAADLSGQSIWCALYPLHNMGHFGIAKDLGKLLLEHGADINTADHQDRTQLSFAAEDGEDDSSLVFALVNAGENVNSSDKDGNTPLHYARQPGIVKYLIEHNANVQAVNNLGQTPLIHASTSNQRYPDVAEKTRVEVCQLHVSNGADINAHGLDGTTALHKAALSKDAAVTKYLLENGAKVELVTETNMTALHYACHAAFNTFQMWSNPDTNERERSAVVEVIRLLLDHGTNLEARDVDGRTPLAYTLYEYEGEKALSVAIDAFNLLIQRSADKNAVDRTGKSVIDYIDADKWLVDEEGHISRRPPPPMVVNSRGGSTIRGAQGRGQGRGRGVNVW